MSAATDVTISNSYLQKLLQTQDAQNRRKVAAQYESTAHVCPTSNICERLFSRAKIVMRPHRRLMDPSTLETLLMLRMNKNLWDEVAIQKIMLKEKAERAKEKAQREAAEQHNSDVEEEEDNHL